MKVNFLATNIKYITALDGKRRPPLMGRQQEVKSTPTTFNVYIEYRPKFDTQRIEELSL